jgi:NAD(P)-dependent dehydrogenase (short-subunit alcohol dehydrogenase family)
MSPPGPAPQERPVLDLFRLDGKVAVVTGASSGLGAAFAVALAQAGADVALGARRVERLSETLAAVEAVGRRAVAVPTDVTRPEDCAALVERTVEALGRVDILVNNAGVGNAVPATRESPEEFRTVVDVNLLGAYWMAQACARAMRSGGSIVNVSSVLSMTTAGLPQAAYAASKAGLNGLTIDLAHQWTGRKGIRVNAVAPGYFPTEMTDQLPDTVMEQIVERRVPERRPGRLQECAAAVVFLASDAASYITGVVLPVDGGLLVG